MMIIQIIVLQAIVFGAVIFFLKKILYNDTQSAVNRLDKAYQDLLGKQRELTQKIQDAEKEYREKKEEVTQVADKLKEEAMSQIRQKEDDVMKSAKVQADEMVQKARASSDKIRKDIEKDVRMKMSDIAANLLQKAFSKELLSVMHQQLVAEFLSREKELDFSAVGAEISSFMIRSAFPIPTADKEKIASMIAKKLGRTLKMEEQQDDALVAGLAIQFGTLVLDGSFANKVTDQSQQEKRSIELEG